MIVSYRDNRTQDFAGGKKIKAFSGFERSAQTRLDLSKRQRRLRIWRLCRAIFSRH
jgi:hypothetical protein